MHYMTRQILKESIVTCKEAAERTGLHAATVRRWAREGKIEGVMKGSTELYDLREIIEFKNRTSYRQT